MNVTPLSIARVPMQLQSSLLLGGVQSNQLGMVGLESQISTGQRLSRSADDPVAAVGIMRLKARQQDLTQYQSNLNFAQGFLSSADNATSGLTDLITQAQTIASSQIGAQSTADERAAQASVIAINVSIRVGWTWMRSWSAYQATASAGSPLRSMARAWRSAGSIWRTFSPRVTTRSG